MILKSALVGVVGGAVTWTFVAQSVPTHIDQDTWIPAGAAFAALLVIGGLIWRTASAFTRMIETQKQILRRLNKIEKHLGIYQPENGNND